MKIEVDLVDGVIWFNYEDPKKARENENYWVIFKLLLIINN